MFKSHSERGTLAAFIHFYFNGLATKSLVMSPKINPDEVPLGFIYLLLCEVLSFKDVFESHIYFQFFSQKLG